MQAHTSGEVGHFMFIFKGLFLDIPTNFH